MVLGQNITLECTVTVPLSVLVYLGWKVPATSNSVRYLKNIFYSTIKLNSRNIILTLERLHHSLCSPPPFSFKAFFLLLCLILNINFYPLGVQLAKLLLNLFYSVPK